MGCTAGGGALCMLLDVCSAIIAGETQNGGGGRGGVRVGVSLIFIFFPGSTQVEP